MKLKRKKLIFYLKSEEFFTAKMNFGDKQQRRGDQRTPVYACECFLP